MSQENVEMVRQAVEAFRRGDWQAMAETIDPHISIRTDASWPEQRIYGREAALAFYRGIAESVGSDTRIEQVIDLGDRVLVRLRLHMRGPHSGVEGDQCYSAICTIRDGRVVLEEYFLDNAAALKVVGLEEQAVSQENVEIVRQAFEAAARGDRDAVLALYDPAVEWDLTRTEDLGLDQVYRGHSGLSRFFREWREAWVSDEYTYDELIDTDGPVISVATQAARGRATGLPAQRTIVGVWTIRDAKIVRVVWFLSREEALKAVGREE